MESRIQKSCGEGYSILLGFEVLTKEGNLINGHSSAKGNWDWELTYWKTKQEAEQFLANYLKGKTMAKLTCKDGTVINISDETEAELRKAFGPRPDYKVHIGCFQARKVTEYIRLAVTNSSQQWNGNTGLETREVQAHSFTHSEVREIIRDLTKLLEN